MTQNAFRNIGMDHTLVAEALIAAGATDVVETAIKADAQIHYRGSLGEHRFLVNLLINRSGKCTIGYASGFDRPTFDRLAEAIAAHCRYSDKRRLEASVPSFIPRQLATMLDYLASERIEISETLAVGHRLFRLRGERGDVLTLKHYANNTLQLQGSHAQVASLTISHLQTVLPLDELLAHQRAVYDIPLTAQQIKSDLTARIPGVHDWLEDTIRIQLTSALALTKVGIALEDYGAVAFPAFRGLEGFCYQIIAAQIGVAPRAKDKLGDYFEQRPSGTALLSAYQASCPKEVAAALIECYTHWLKHRHRLFHMDGTLGTTRIIEDREEAVQLVGDVLDLIERIHASLPKGNSLI